MSSREARPLSPAWWALAVGVAALVALAWPAGDVVEPAPLSSEEPHAEAQAEAAPSLRRASRPPRGDAAPTEAAEGRSSLPASPPFVVPPPPKDADPWTLQWALRDERGRAIEEALIYFRLPGEEWRLGPLTRPIPPEQTVDAFATFWPLATGERPAPMKTARWGDSVVVLRVRAESRMRVKFTGAWLPREAWLTRSGEWGLGRAQRSVVDHEGACEFRALDARGLYTLWARAHAEERRDHDVAYREGVPGDRGEIELAMAAGEEIRGRLLAPDGKPIQRVMARVLVVGRGFRAEARSLGDGTFRVVGLPHGRWLVRTGEEATDAAGPANDVEADTGSEVDVVLRAAR